MNAQLKRTAQSEPSARVLKKRKTFINAASDAQRPRAMDSNLEPVQFEDNSNQHESRHDQATEDHVEPTADSSKL